MSRRLKIALYQIDGEDPSVLEAFQEIEGLRVVGQWDGTCDLGSTVTQTRPDVLAALLNGPSAKRILGELGALSREHPNTALMGIGLPDSVELLRAAMQAKVAAEMLDLPVEPEKLLAALENIAERQTARPSGRLVAVYGTGGGSGATTIAANLAVELAKRDAGRVVVVDLDLRFGQIATMFDVSPSFTIAELSQQSEEYDERVLGNSLAEHDSGVLVLARPREPEGASVSLVKVSAILNALLEYYDWVVVDGVGHSNMTARVVQDLADDLLLVTQPVVTSVRNASQVISGLSSGFNRERLRIIVNRVPKKAGIVTPARVSEVLKLPVYHEIPDDSEVVCEAINLGLPLAQHASGSKVRCAIRDLASRLAGGKQKSVSGSSGMSVMGWLKDRLGAGSHETAKARKD